MQYFLKKMLKNFFFWKTEEKIDFSVKQNEEEYFEKISDRKEEKSAHLYIYLCEKMVTSAYFGALEQRIRKYMNTKCGNT